MLPGLSSRTPITECQRQAGALLSICKGKKKKEERKIYLHFFLSLLPFLPLFSNKENGRKGKEAQINRDFCGF